MLVRASSGSSGGGSGESLIFYDWSNGGYGGLLTYYDTDWFDLVSGSFKASAAGVSDITVRAKKSGTITLYFQNGSSSNATFEVNGTNVATSTPLETSISISANDTIQWVSPMYYGSCIVTGA